MSSATITINANPHEVWQALTDPAQVKQYLFGTNLTADWQVGGKVTYQGEWEGKKYEDTGEVLELVPDKKLVTTYKSSMSDTDDVVTYELEETAAGTKLTISQAKGTADNWNTVLTKLKEVVESASSSQ